MTIWPVLAGYVIGSVPAGFLLARWLGVDPRRVGSGNVGATNVFRATGWRAGVAVMALDLGKGFGAVLLAERWRASEVVAVWAGAAAVVGHVFPVWLRGRGGKGVATSCGVFVALAPVATAIAAAVFLITVWATRLVSAGSLLATMLLPAAAALTGSSAAVVSGGVAVAALVVGAHRANVQRLWRGTERRLGASAGRSNA